MMPQAKHLYFRPDPDSTLVMTGTLDTGRLVVDVTFRVFDGTKVCFIKLAELFSVTMSRGRFNTLTTVPGFWAAEGSLMIVAEAVSFFELMDLLLRTWLGCNGNACLKMYLFVTLVLCFVTSFLFKLSNFATQTEQGALPTPQLHVSSCTSDRSCLDVTLRCWFFGGTEIFSTTLAEPLSITYRRFNPRTTEVTCWEAEESLTTVVGAEFFT